MLRYLKGSQEFGLVCLKGGEGVLLGYSDSDRAQERPERKSVRGFVFTFAGGAISWKSKKQPVVAQRSVEAEYVALADAIREEL